MHKPQEKQMSPLILTLKSPKRKYTLCTDAYNVQAGYVLLQEQPDETAKPVGYWPRSLINAEQAHYTKKRECHAIAWSALMLPPYLEETRFTTRTDHDSLKRILDPADAICRLVCSRVRLSKFDFNVVHCTGINDQIADGLSHLATTGEAQVFIEDDATVELLETKWDNRPNICLVTNMINILDETSEQTVALVAENNDTKKKGVASTLHATEVFTSSGHRILLETNHEQCWAGIC